MLVHRLPCVLRVSADIGSRWREAVFRLAWEKSPIVKRDVKTPAERGTFGPVEEGASSCVGSVGVAIVSWDKKMAFVVAVDRGSFCSLIGIFCGLVRAGTVIPPHHKLGCS